jgi:hypothetical protein
LAFHDGRMISGMGHVPGQIFARCAAAEYEDVRLFRLSHDALLARGVVSLCRVLRMRVGHPMAPWVPRWWDCTANRVPTLKQPGRR